MLYGGIQGGGKFWKNWFAIGVGRFDWEYALDVDDGDSVAERKPAVAIALLCKSMVIFFNETRKDEIKIK